MLFPSNKQVNETTEKLEKESYAVNISEEKQEDLKNTFAEIKEKLEDGTVTHLELVNAYMELTSPHLNDKQRSKLRIKLLKTPKPMLKTMFKQAIKLSNL